MTYVHSRSKYLLHCFQTFLSYRMTTHSFNVLMFTTFIPIWIPNKIMVKNVALTFWVWNPLRCLMELWYLTNPRLYSLWGITYGTFSKCMPIGHFQNHKNRMSGVHFQACMFWKTFPGLEPLHYSLTSFVPTTFEIKGKHTQILIMYPYLQWDY